VLLMAFAALSQDDLDLVVCGPDQARGAFARFADRLGLKGRVRWLGSKKPDQVKNLLDECLFFVLPSRRENMPMALLEAMAAGKAAIASDVGGVSEAIVDGVNGLLVPAQDARALTRAMRRLAESSVLRGRLGRRALERARDFSWSSAAAGYRKIYYS